MTLFRNTHRGHREQNAFDTDIWFTRSENYHWLGEDSPKSSRRTILTAVVASELYAGTSDRRQKQALDELCRAHQALGRFASPTAAAWVGAG